MTWRSNEPVQTFSQVIRHVWHRSRGSISLWIIWVCIGLFLTVAALDVVRVISRQRAFLFLGLSCPGIAERLWLHQFVTAPLLHGSIVHLLFNMLSLWMLGPGVETVLGKARYVLFTALCAVTSMLGFLLFDWGRGHIVCGYSGVIFGILVAQAVLHPDTRIAIFAFFPLKMKHAALLLGAVELYLTVSPESGGIAHAAHLFGAATAFVYLRASRLLKHSLRKRRAVSAAEKVSDIAIRKGRMRIPRRL